MSNQHSRLASSWSPARRILGVLMLLTTACGASCQQFRDAYPTAGPRVLPQTATLNDVISVVNDNSSRIRTLYAPDASVSAPMTPSLRATLVVERPGNFRIRAETGLTGPEVDLGSNESLFWLWVRRMQPPAVFYCRHEQFAYSAVRQFMPVEPKWLIDALGITGFDPAGQHSGPYPVGRGRLEMRTVIPRPEGALTKITIIDAARAWVLEQNLYDANGTRIASSITSRHWRDPESGLTVPRRIDIQWPATQASLSVELRTIEINKLGTDASQWFAMPSFPGSPTVDVGDPNFRIPVPAMPAAAPAAAAQESRRGGWWR